MKRNATSIHSFSPEQVAAALGTASDVPIEDADNPRTQASDWETAVSSSSLPELRAKLAARRRRGSQKAPRKIPTTIRFDSDVLIALKSTGNGWQTRVNEAMREWVESHAP